METMIERHLADVDGMPFEEALLYTSEEYLRRERGALDRHEFHNGKVCTMPGASKKHNIIASNLNHELQTYVRNHAPRFSVFQSDLRVFNSITMRYVYPDIVIAESDNMVFSDSNEDILLNPVVIIEILAKSTEQYDRTEKFDAYKGIESLQEYALVGQRAPHIEIFTRKNRLEWLYTERFALDDEITLHSVGMPLRLQDVYAKVNFGNDATND